MFCPPPPSPWRMDPSREALWMCTCTSRHRIPALISHQQTTCTANRPQLNGKRGSNALPRVRPPAWYNMNEYFCSVLWLFWWLCWRTCWEWCLLKCWLRCWWKCWWSFWWRCRWMCWCRCCWRWVMRWKMEEVLEGPTSWYNIPQSRPIKWHT